MLTRMHHLWRAVQERFSAGTTARPRPLSGFEQTRLSWARPIESYDAVPAAFRGFFEPFLAGGRPLPYAVLTPSYEGFLHRPAEKLVCDCDPEICVLERSGSVFAALRYPLAEIRYVEVRTILLDSRIKITGVTSQGALASSTLRFNTVTDYLFTPLLEKMRRASAVSPPAVQGSGPEWFGQWVYLNFKFMNFARHSLLAGEKVIDAVLQPEIRARVLTILGKTYYRVVAPTLAAILTDRELIFIREEERQAEDKYGGIWDYIPLNRIARLTLREKGVDLLSLSVQLSGEAGLEFLFQASAQPDVNRLLGRFRELTSG